MAEGRTERKLPVKDVFIIEEGADGKKYWHVAGVAFVNGDGSINLKLHLFPNVQMQIRDRKERE
jgi:hypothetical protein